MEPLSQGFLRRPAKQDLQAPSQSRRGAVGDRKKIHAAEGLPARAFGAEPRAA